MSSFEMFRRTGPGTDTLILPEIPVAEGILVPSNLFALTITTLVSPASFIAIAFACIFTIQYCDGVRLFPVQLSDIVLVILRKPGILDSSILILYAVPVPVLFTVIVKLIVSPYSKVLLSAGSFVTSSFGSGSTTLILPDIP